MQKKVSRKSKGSQDKSNQHHQLQKILAVFASNQPNLQLKITLVV